VSAFDPIFCATGPTMNLRTARFDRRPHQLNPFDPEIRRDPEGRADIPGQRWFNENQATNRHRPI